MVKDSKGNEWLSPKEAAQYLELSVGRIYHLKDKLTHMKGEKRLFFLKSALLDDYINIRKLS